MPSRAAAVSVALACAFAFAIASPRAQIRPEDVAAAGERWLATDQTSREQLDATVQYLLKEPKLGIAWLAAQLPAAKEQPASPRAKGVHGLVTHLALEHLRRQRASGITFVGQYDGLLPLQPVVGDLLFGWLLATPDWYPHTHRIHLVAPLRDLNSKPPAPEHVDAIVQIVDNERIESLLGCQSRALAYFGGVPRKVLYDNMKTVVIQRGAYGEGLHRFHAALWDQAKTYGFEPKLCAPYRAQTKGKVERFIRYFRECFWIPLTTRLQAAGEALTIELANAELRRWLAETADQRRIREIDARPVDRFAQERQALQPLPNTTAPATGPGVAMWPRERLQRSPQVYQQLFEVHA